MTAGAASPAGESGNGDRGPRQLWSVLALVVVGFFASFGFWPRLFYFIGVNHYGAWFLDTFALLASNDAVTRGLDPYAPNPLDYFNRPHVYSHFWLHLRDLGLTRADVVWLGFSVVAVFLVTALVKLRPRTWRQLLWYAAIFCSAPVLLAVERANNDLVIFVLLAPVVACVRSRRSGVWLVGLLLVTIAALLKYYPAVAALVVLNLDDRRELRIRVVVVALVLGLAGLILARDLAGYGAVAPKPAGLLSFGGAAIFSELGSTGWMAKVLSVGAGALVVILAWRKRWLGGWEPSVTQSGEWLHFILGASLLTGCFFTNLNYGYRWIFALWLAPMLWDLLHDATTPSSVRRVAKWTAGLMFAVFWWDPVCCFVVNQLAGLTSGPALMKAATICFIIEQPLDWALFVALLIFLTHYAQGLARVFFGRSTAAI